MSDRLLALVIEDEPDILELLEGHLRRIGFEVVGASTGERALDLARTEPPALAMVDIHLPGIDGREVIRRLRADPRTEHCFVVVCSVIDPSDLQDVDADAVLRKPFGRKSLDRLVRDIANQGGR